MTVTYDHMLAAAESCRRVVARRPRVAMILGTGQSGVGEKLVVEGKLAYGQLPHFVTPTVTSHAGEFLFGRFAGQDVIAFSGRFHYYEGYALETVVLPVRVAALLGAEILTIQGVAGGLNPRFSLGDLMVVEDHINLMGVNPLIGENDERLGGRFPDMSAPYDRKLIALAEKAALEEKIRLQQGVYAALTGPSLETRAEYRMLRALGADAVGMSTVPEVIAAVHCGLRTLAIVTISDMCLPDALEPADLKKIVQVGVEAEPKATRILERVVAEL